MISKRLNDEINKQITREFYSAYLYLSMKAYFDDQDFDGFSNFFDVQVKEERDHALKFINYIDEQSGKLELFQIDGPPKDFDSFIQVFEMTLEHEQFVTANIYNLMNIAVEEKDHRAQTFLQWFVNEQAEEESTMNRYLNKLKFVKDSPDGILMIDTEMATRTYTPATTTGA